MARILVAYASEKGSTAGIAQAIAKEITVHGNFATFAEARGIMSLGGYNAVVIGGPVYMGKVAGDIPKFVKRNREALALLPVAGFAVGLAAASKDQKGIGHDEEALRAALMPLKPVDIAVFAGALDPAKLSWFQNWIMKKMKSPVGDFRDWAAIAAWAEGLPLKLGL